MTPLIAPLHWLAFAPKGGLRTRDAALFALYPTGYFLIAIAVGARTGFYPCPFINVAALGIACVAINAVAIAAGFMLAGSVLVALDRRLAG